MTEIVYVDMVADLFHAGHVNLLKTAREKGDLLYVGVHSDEDVYKYKRMPIISMENRIKVVESCKYVDKVFPNAPLKVTKEFCTNNGITKIIHGDDISEENRNYFYGDVIDIYNEISYTKDVSTTMLIKYIKQI